MKKFMGFGCFWFTVGILRDFNFCGCTVSTFDLRSLDFFRSTISLLGSFWFWSAVR